MRNARPALLFQKDNPNLCKKDVNAGQFRGKNHRDEPENPAEAPGHRTHQRNTSLLGPGASRRTATASALSRPAAAAYPAAEQDLRTPERRNAAAASAAPRMIRRVCPHPRPPPSSREFSGGCPGERPPPQGGSAPRGQAGGTPASREYLVLPARPRHRPLCGAGAGLAALAAPLGSAPAPPGRAQPRSARPAQGRSGGRGAAPPGPRQCSVSPAVPPNAPGGGTEGGSPCPGRTASSPGPFGSVPLSSPAQSSLDNAFRPPPLFLMQEFLPSL